MTADLRPRIAITMRIELETNRFYLSRYYIEAVEAAGGLPLLIPLIPRPDFITAVVAACDGLLLPGSDSDIDPARYGQDPHPLLGSVHLEKDETDLLALAVAEERRMPVLAICFGLQSLNVSRGGTLIQDIPSTHPAAIKHQQGVPRDRHSHRVSFLKGGMLEQLAGSDTAPVNSHHHQAVETVGRDLTGVAWAPDGLIEAVADPRDDRFVVGVQWHPELGWERDPLSLALFTRFVQEARGFAAKEQNRELASATV